MDSSVAPVMEGKALSTGQKRNSGGWKSAIFIIFVEMAERFAYYGVAGNLINYLTSVLGEPVADAAKSVNTWIGVSSLFPILGAFVADSYLGRFKTILLSSIIYFSGLVLLVVSASVVPWRLRRALFYVALYILSVGEGGHKPCVQTFAADQFDEDLPEEKSAKSSFFNWWYLGIVFGATSAVLAVIYVEDHVGWALGFGMPAVAVAVALVIFLIGVRTYRRQRPAGSPFTMIAQVFVAAVRKRSAEEGRQGFVDIDYELDHEDASHILARTNQFRFLDKATIVDDRDALAKARNPWRLCSRNQVEEVKLVLRLVPVWLCCFTFAIVIAQMSTFFTKQGSTLIRTLGTSHFQIPPASLQVFPGLTILITVPLYDRLLVPVARRITGHPSGITILQRMGIGMCIATLTMVVSALVETKRVSIALHHGLMDKPKSIVPMQVWWLIPQYMLCGLADVFTIVGMQELFYDQMPEEMRSMGAAAYISTVGVGNFMSSAVISVIQAVTSRGGDKWLGNNLNRARLNYFYWVLAGMSALNLFVYVLVAKGFVYKKIQKDQPMLDREKGCYRTLGEES